MKNYQQKSAHKEHDPRIKAGSVKDYMARDLVTFGPNTTMTKVIDTLLKHRISGAPVLDEKGGLLGIIDDKDCVNVLLDQMYHNQPANKLLVKQYMSNVMKTINIDSDLVEVANLFTRTNFKRLLVVDDNGKLVGQISRRDIVRAIQDMESTTWHKG